MESLRREDDEFYLVRIVFPSFLNVICRETSSDAKDINEPTDLDFNIKYNVSYNHNYNLNYKHLLHQDHV